MKNQFRKLLIFAIFISHTIYSAPENTVHVSMVNSTAIAETLPFEALSGKEWRAVSTAEYVKFHIYLDDAVYLKSVSLEACEEKFNSDATLYVNFDERVLSLIRNENHDKMVMNIEDPVLARSLTINFQRNQKVCFKNFTVINKNNQKIQFEMPQTMNGEVVASLETGESYNAMNLFDSRFEYAWSPVPEDKDRSLEFKFKNTMQVTGLKIWNGYQRSDIHCVRNGRAKEILVSGDNDYNEKITLEDKMEPQLIRFSKPFHGQNIKLAVVSVYGGKMFQEPAISELRFLDGDNEFMLNPLTYMQQIRIKNESAFTLARFGNFLDKDMAGNTAMKDESKKHAWVSAASGLNMRERPAADSKVVILLQNNTELEILQQNEKKETIGGKEGRWIMVSSGKKTGWVFDAFVSYHESENVSANYGYWTVRLRGDGSMYMDGSESKTINQGSMGETKTVYILGNYKIIESSNDELILELFGLIRTVTKKYSIGMDCNGCGRDCNRLGTVKDDGSQEEVFVERVKIKNTHMEYILTNMAKDPALGFRKLTVKNKK